jgi:hypothetical protein
VRRVRTDRWAAALVASPFAWQVFLVVEWFAVGWLLSLVLPGDPSTYQTWVKIVIFAAWTSLFVGWNYLLRRSLLRRSVDRSGATEPDRAEEPLV